MLSFALATLSSCSSLKAPPAKPSAFLPHAAELRKGDHHSPFQLNWHSPDADAVIQSRQKVYVAPLSLAYLRPMSRGFSARAFSESERQQAARNLANYANSKVADAFANAGASRFKLVSRPDRNALTIELALVEFNPNSTTGGVLRTAINAAAVPGVDSVLLKRLKGNISVEGKVSDGATKRSIFEFSDNQENKSALIISVNDFKSYGQARQAIDEWARQIEETLRTPRSTRVSRASSFVILPWH
ncbi:MAG: hypothetical protein JWO89_2190 [Verrucomicrobiaceae bacterium]|nr:hypothetical protein [Verrucomicrobiaceae bacterium]MDB6117521.1 hypothetical protein [Verrucomicrobiaceae bacterium]